MIIKSINIISFSGLKNVNINFSKNLNVVFGSNGAGKSTIMNFIKLMFYGKTENERSTDISKNLRKKTRPLDGSKQQGSITFIHNDIEYIIEKTLGLTVNSDEVLITDVTNGKVLNLGANVEPGKYFLGLTLPQFERCAYILSNDFTKLETELNDIKEFSFKNSSENEQETNSPVSELIKQKENLISKSKKKGLIVEKEAEINNLFFQISECLNNEKIVEELDDKFNLKKAEIEKLKNDLENNNQAEKKSKKLQIFIDMLNFKRNILALKNYFSKFDENILVEEFVSLGDILYNNTLSRQRIKDETYKKDDTITFEKLKNDYESANNILAELNKLSGVFADLENKLEIKSKVISEKKNLRTNLIVTIFSAFLSICSLIFSLKLKILPLMLLTATFIVILLFTSFSALKIAKNIKKSISLVPDNLDVLVQKNNELTDKLNSELYNIFKVNNVTSIEELNKIFYKQNAIISTDNERFETALKDSVNKFIKHISQFKEVFSFEEAETVFDEIKTKLASMKQIENEYTSFLKLSGSEDISVNELKEKIDEYTLYLERNKPLTEAEKTSYDKKISDLADELISLKGKYPKESTPLSELQKEEEKLKNELNNLNKTYSAISLAEEVIKEAANELSLDFLPRLNSEATKILSMLENNENNEMIITDNITPKVKKDLAGSFIQSAYLSESEKNRVYLSLRFALMDIIENQLSFSLPVFADDILANYDMESSLQAISFLSEIAKKRQIIFFTCHSELADKFISPIAVKITL